MIASDEYRTAVHEAGHAVVGRVFGMLCGGATIERDEDGAAFAVTHDPHVTQWHYEQCARFIDIERLFRRRVYAYMAGAEAEIIFFGIARGAMETIAAR